jgi:hypothetical protein
MTNARVVFCQLMELDWLKANRKTGIKKNENDNRRCFTVLLSNHDMMYIFLICEVLISYSG